MAHTSQKILNYAHLILTKYSSQFLLQLIYLFTFDDVDYDGG